MAGAAESVCWTALARCGAAVALLAPLSGVHARHDAAGVTENREALGSADRPQAPSKKSRPG